MTEVEGIQYQISRLKEWAVIDGKMDCGAKKAIDKAERWLINGNEYDNQDADILHALLVYTKSAN